MARRKLFWHIGPDDPGTEFLSAALAGSTAELQQAGIATPSGRWHEVEKQIWRHKGLSLLSTPRISRADKDKVALRLSGLRDIEAHLVLVVRDLPTAVHAAWQTGLQHGSTTSLKKYATRVLDAERSHWQAEEFWAGRDLARILPLWTRAFHADRVHVIAAPADPAAIWAEFLSVSGAPALPLPEVAMPPALSAELDTDRVLDITTGWAKLIADRGYDMRGSLLAAAANPPEAAGRAEQLEAVAELLTTATSEVERLGAEVERLRAEAERLDRKRRKHKRRLAELTR